MVPQSRIFSDLFLSLIIMSRFNQVLCIIVHSALFIYYHLYRIVYKYWGKFHCREVPVCLSINQLKHMRVISSSGQLLSYINICTQIFVWTCLYFTLEKYLGMKLLGQMIHVCLNFIRNCKTLFTGGLTFIHLYNVWELWLHPCQHFILSLKKLF